jgi:GNAT superfamily N-acetyltransferase
VVTIERARQEDFASLKALIEITFVETWTGLVSDKHIQQHLDEGHAVGLIDQFSFQPKTDIYIARQNDDLVGYSIGSLVDVDDKFGLHNYYRLEKLYLRSHIQGKGIGKRLWDVMVASAKQFGAIGMYLTHYPRNGRASMFYSYLGLLKVADTIYQCGDGEYHDWVLAATWSDLERVSESKGTMA